MRYRFVVSMKPLPWALCCFSHGWLLRRVGFSNRPFVISGAIFASDQARHLRARRGSNLDAAAWLWVASRLLARRHQLGMAVRSDGRRAMKESGLPAAVAACLPSPPPISAWSPLRLFWPASFARGAIAAGSLALPCPPPPPLPGLKDHQRAGDRNALTALRSRRRAAGGIRQVPFFCASSCRRALAPSLQELALALLGGTQGVGLCWARRASRSPCAPCRAGHAAAAHPARRCRPRTPRHGCCRRAWSVGSAAGNA